MRKICLLIGLILSFSASSFSQTDRVIDFSPVQPGRNITKIENGKFVPTDLKGVELVEISVEGKSITAGKSFAAGDDWLKTLTIKLKNVSDKAISSVRMSFIQPEAKFKDSSLGFSFAFGSLSVMADDRAIKKLIQPGEEFELSQTEAQYLRGKTFTTEKSGVTNINRIIIGMTIVQFEDGEQWTAMKMPSFK